MKRFQTLLIAFTVLLAACGGSRSASVEDFSTGLYTPEFASGFDIRGTDGGRSTLLTIRNPWQGAQQVEQHLLLLRDDEEAPAGFGGTAVRLPIRRTVCMSSSHVALFDALGEIRRVAGVSGIDFISNPYIQNHRLCGEVRDVGYDTQLDFELLAALRPDLVLLYGVTGENTIVTGKLRELGIPYVYMGEYLEESPLGKAEWIMAVAEMCDCRERGDSVFRQTAARYDRLARRIEHHLSQNNAVRPRVMLNTPYRDTWFLPPARNYMVRLIRDAGGEAFTGTDSGNASQPVELEQAYLLAAAADAWLHTGACRTLDELKLQNPKFADLPVVRRRMVYNNDRRRTPAGGSDFWESGTVRPDLVLRDLATILHPELGADSLVYYQRLE